MSTIKANQWLSSDGTENYKCKAWVNFNGTGTVAIRASGNVSSITDNGTGDYTVNFTTAMTDADYSCAISMAGAQGYAVPSSCGANLMIGTKTTTSQRVYSGQAIANNNVAWSAVDYVELSLAIFR